MMKKMILLFTAALIGLAACTGDFDIPPQKGIDSDVDASRHGSGATWDKNAEHP